MPEESNRARPAKRAKLDIEGNVSDASDSDASRSPSGFKVNEEYARRFEHNKKREELHKLQEKYGSSDRIRPTRLETHGDGDDGDGSDSEDSSSLGDEDDEAELATEALDAEISATLKAIKTKDPRVYNNSFTFYKQEPGNAGEKQDVPLTNKEKPLYLKDYHRKNILEGYTGSDDEDAAALNGRPSYAQEQEALKQGVVEQMHKLAGVPEEAAAEVESSGDDEDGFLVKKRKKSGTDADQRQINAESKNVRREESAATEDPEGFLSKFVSSRQWIPGQESKFQPFESDDEDDEKRTEAFEEAYNMRFENPDASNEKLMSHARDAAAKYSVRKEMSNVRKKTREKEKEKRQARDADVHEERSRLRKLKIEEIEEKVKRIKEAAGLRGKQVREDEWLKFLNEGWSDSRWDAEMNKYFGESYYAERDGDLEDGENGAKYLKKLKKPKWEDDIDIKDLVPGFEDEPTTSRSDMMPKDSEKSHEEATTSKKDAERERKRAARKERRKIEELADQSVELETLGGTLPSKTVAGFRYRETSPTSYGLTSRDILMASDSQLNQYAGLKKLAAFRDPVKKHKDQKHLGKKARLRKWRKETFGSEEGPKGLDEAQINGTGKDTENDRIVVDGDASKSQRKKRKRSGKKKENQEVDV